MSVPDTSPDPTKPDLADVLATERGGRRARAVWWTSVAIVLVVAGLIALSRMRASERSSVPRYVTEETTVGTLVVRVSATGNLEPTNQVEVGSELSGIVTEVLVDDNDRVTRNQVLLSLDTSRLEAAVATSRASLDVARAQVRQAEAAVAELRAARERLDEVSRLSDGRLPAGVDMDAAIAALARAEADLDAARAAVTRARANLRSDEATLEKATIRSPIDGVVLSRDVEPGHTVAATLQAPVLFTIAEDLSTMELRVDVDEADVGKVEVGQASTFTVDAWPGRNYDGVIVRVGLGAQTTNDVVTYPAVLAVTNDDLSLRPGMTASVDIVTAVREGALLVPNAALRFDPTDGRQRPPSTRRGVERLIPRPPAQTIGRELAASTDVDRVWVLREGRPTAVDVRTGATDGTFTEVLGGELEAGTEVITERRGSAS